MTGLLTLASGRRAKFAVLAAWLLVAFLAAPLGGKLEEAQENDVFSFLPGEAESVRALKEIRERSEGSLTQAVVVYHRDGGLSAADRRKIERDRASLAEDRPPEVLAPRAPITAPGGATALTVLPIAAEGNADIVVDSTEEIRERVGEGGGDLTVKVTGAAGFTADAIAVFESIDTTLLLAAATLVFILLVLIYRSPIFWFIPFVTVVLAELTSRAMAYGLAEAGITVNGQSASILTVLVFGAGTDYALLLVARYREELRRHEDAHDAMRRALRRAGPAIVFSGLTVVAALLTLAVAEVNSSASLGPIGALGIALAVLAMVTLLPALLIVAGRRAFWPFIPHVGDEAADETHGRWRQLGERVARRPRLVWIGATLVLFAMAAGLFGLNGDLTTSNGYREDVEAVQGQRLLSAAFPAGESAPTSVTVAEPGDLEPVRDALRRVEGVARVGPAQHGEPVSVIEVALSADPYGSDAFDLVPELRRAARDAAEGPVLVGGATAQEFDLRESVTRDNRLIIPIALAVVLLILVVLLRALVVPLLLIGSVIVSFGAALGAGVLAFDHIFGFPGTDPALPLFAFVFLVALGIDYNIFLMARVREETRASGTREGMLRGLAVTGGVITSAGIVLAGTFLILAVLPLYTLTEIGLVVAFGVLLDTFVVRSVLVPALVLDIGPRAWWPSSLAGRD